MSKIRRLRIDVYGRFRADVIRKNGAWIAYRLGPEGKRIILGDLPLHPDASPEEVVHAFEAAYHELARPGDELVVIDILMA